LFPRLIYTDGVKHLIVNADCFWLLDIIGSFQPIAKKDESLRDMQFWHLKPYPQPEKHKPLTVGHMLQVTGKMAAPKPNIKTKGGIMQHLKPQEGGTPMAYVTCDRDSDDTAIVQDILMTDFPFDAMPEVSLYVQRNVAEDGKERMVVCLPSEY
jgi:hypothetical protein